ncbi:MAG: extracellular solute-binding protein [Chloroflexota bacterium]
MDGRTSQLRRLVAGPTGRDPSSGIVTTTQPRPKAALLAPLTALILWLTGCGLDRFTANPAPTASPTSAVGPRPTAAPASIVATWHQQAQSEGQVRVHADLSPKEAEEIEKDFSRRYPKVRIEWTRGSDVDLVDRLRANGAIPDVMIGDNAAALKQAGMAERWTPPESRGIKADLFDPDGAWYALAMTYYVMQLNTELVPAAAQPRAYQQLADPGWLGKLSLDQDALPWFQGLIEVYGRQPTLDALRPLAAQGVRFRRGPQLVADFISAGQDGLAIANRLDAVERSKRAGAKTAWWTVEPVIVRPTAVVLLQLAPNPSAARLFANYVLSAPAQAILAEWGRIPSREDVDPEPQDLVQRVRIHVTRQPDAGTAADLRAQWDDLWGLR